MVEYDNINENNWKLQKYENSWKLEYYDNQSDNDNVTVTIVG